MGYNWDARMRNPDGSVKSYAERREIYRREAEEAKKAEEQRQKDVAARTTEYMQNRSKPNEVKRQEARLDAQLARHEPAKKTKAEVFADHVASLKQKLASAPTWERGPIERRIAMFEDSIAKEQKAIEQQKRIETIAQDKWLLNAREHSGAFERMPPDESERAAATALNAFINRQFETVEQRDAAIKLYWHEVSASMDRATARLKHNIQSIEAEISPAALELEQLKQRLNSLEGKIDDDVQTDGDNPTQNPPTL